jgi:hypothetical protein
MRRRENSDPGREVGDDVIDEMARALMTHEPAAGFGRDVAARLDNASAAQRGPGLVALAARVALAGVALAVIASLWNGHQPEPAPEAPVTRGATRTPTATPTRPVHEAAASPAPAGPTPGVVAARRAARPSRAERLWASRAAPEVERTVVTPVPRPAPLVIEPLELPAIAVDDLAIEPLAVESLNFDVQRFPNDNER